MRADQTGYPARRDQVDLAEPAPQAAPGQWSRVLRSPRAVAALVFIFYGGYLALFLLSGHQPLDFIHLGLHYVERSNTSSLIKVDPNYSGYVPVGYDGQFYYFIALDPAHAAPYTDAPAYRYTRILYPMAARLLALGMPAVIPLTLILVNLLALTGGTLALAAWLRRKGVSPWFALAFSFYPGLLIAFQNDLTEPLAYALVALAVYLFDFGGRYRLLWAGICFALATLSRETTVVFPIIYGLAVLWGKRDAGDWRERFAANWRGAALLLVVGVAPLLLWKGYLYLWLGQVGVPSVDIGAKEGGQLVGIPFQGIYDLQPWGWPAFSAILAIAAPGVVAACVGIWALKQGVRHVAIWAMLANVLLFVILLGPASYSNFAASEPVSTGAVLAALFCLPIFDPVVSKSRWWFWACLLLWQMGTLLKITHSLLGFPNAAL